MKQFELANALGITPGMVSRLAKRGMPTDSLERAQRWRKRHLEPGRVKGSRFDANDVQPASKGKPAQSGGQGDRSQVLLAQVPPVAEVERVACDLNTAMVAGGFDLERLSDLRELLRLLPVALDAPRLPLRVWLDLVDHALEEDSAVRHSDNMDACVSAGEFGDLIRPGADLGGTWFAIACDDV